MMRRQHRRGGQLFHRSRCWPSGMVKMMLETKAVMMVKIRSVLVGSFSESV